MQPGTKTWLSLSSELHHRFLEKFVSQSTQEKSPSWQESRSVQTFTATRGNNQRSHWGRNPNTCVCVSLNAADEQAMNRSSVTGLQHDILSFIRPDGQEEKVVAAEALDNLQ